MADDELICSLNDVSKACDRDRNNDIVNYKQLLTSDENNYSFHIVTGNMNHLEFDADASFSYLDPINVSNDHLAPKSVADTCSGDYVYYIADVAESTFSRLVPVDNANNSLAQSLVDVILL